MNKKQSQIPLISIILPFYNVEDVYFNSCIEPFRIYNDPRLELIIIDDGSKPAYAQKLDNLLGECASVVRIIHQKNGGANSARTNGIEHANGEYIQFLDGDDRIEWQEELKLLDLLSGLTMHPDILRTGVVVRDIEGNFVNEYCYWTNNRYVRASVNESIITSGAPYLNIYRRIFFLKYGIPLPTGIRLEDDLAATVPLFFHTSSVFKTDIAPYCRVYRENSMTTVPDATLCLEPLKAFDYILSKNPPNKYNSEIEYLAITHLIINDIKRAIQRDGLQSRYISNILYYMRKRFPHWKRNRYLYTRLNPVSLIIRKIRKKRHNNKICIRFS